MEAHNENCLEREGRFAMVDDLAPVRFLSRTEFDLLKQGNPRLIEMKVGDIVYLTEPPPKG